MHLSTIVLNISPMTVVYPDEAPLEILRLRLSCGAGSDWKALHLEVNSSRGYVTKEDGDVMSVAAIKEIILLA